ncbi:MAG: BMP family ABC transporter substrate-binding protein [Gammaproteobacteria bacterium TMED1]|nr:MAG: BMP family ABC transporter substrate-binding protein [Gammaproteobacteria bacterium TMED1]
MVRKKYKHLLLLILMGYVTQTIAQKPLKVAFLYQHPVNAGGWSLSHEQGRLDVGNELGSKITTIALEGIQPGPDTLRTLTNLARENYELIFATSFGHMNSVMRVARSFPQTSFQHASGYKTAPNVGTYQIRAMQGRYLAGKIAGYMSTSQKIGYVASFPIPEVIRGINAFTLGAQAANPDVTVQAIWINSWMNAAKEREATELLINLGADVITHHTETPALMVAAEEAGVWAVGYQYDRSQFAPNSHLVTIEHNWGPIYKSIIQDKLAGRWKSESLWFGVDHDATRLVSISSKVPTSILSEIEEIRSQMANKTFKIFKGPIIDIEGKKRLELNQSLEDEALIGMEWFVRGVINAE